MDPYEKKFAEMQKYIPFLEAMIEKLKKVKDKSREPQLQKMRSLHGILSKSNDKKLTIEKLDRCEELLLKLHSRVDKVSVSSSNTHGNKISEDTKPINTGNLVRDTTASPISTSKDSDMYRGNASKRETPASPSPPASPDQTSDSNIIVKPIIIPTERNDGYTGTTMDDRPASPDECELVASVGLRQPVIIPTEPIEIKPKYNLVRKPDSENSNSRVAKWTFPCSVKSSATAQRTNLWQTTDDKTTGSISTVTSTSASKQTSNSRPRVLRHIPTVPTPSKGASLIRKPVLVLEKKNNQSTGSETDSPTTKWDSVKSNVTDTDSLNQRAMQSSPKTKELPPLPKLPATPLLVSPPPVLTMPPLTHEDIAELLSDGDDGKTHRNSETAKENTGTRTGVSDRLNDDASRHSENKDVDARIGTSPSKEPPKNRGFTHDDVDSDRRWEEEYKQIVKMPSRRVFPSSSATPPKHSEIKFPPNPPAPVNQTDRPTDPRKRPPSPAIKERDASTMEPRYADNYEKHQRQPRDSHNHNSIPDLNQINSAFSRVNDGDTNNSMPNDDRNSVLYSRRNYGPAAMHESSTSDPRREKSEYYNRMMHHQDPQNVNNRAPLHHSPSRNPEVCNQSQWVGNANYPSVPQGPNVPYGQQRPDMWTMKAGTVNNPPMEPHMMGDSGYMRQGQYSGPPNNCRGPMMSPQDMNHVACMDQGFRDDMPNQSMMPPLLPQMGPPTHGSVMPQHGPSIPPLLQPQGYQMGGQYRGFPPENRPPPQQFDRPQDFPHPRQSWDQPVNNRPPDNIPYSRQQPAPGQWNRSNRGPPVATGAGPLAPPQGGPGPINRDRSYNDRGRGSEPPRPSGFNRDPRTRTDSPAQLQQQHGPTGQTGGSRRDHVPPPPPPPPPSQPPQSGPPPQNANSSTAPNNSRRDPRYAKDPAQTTSSKSKDHGSVNDRNPRRSSEQKNKSVPVKDVRKINDKSRSQHNKNDKKGRRDNTDGDNKIVEKPSKDVMQSPLESLYGVIDTAAKTGKGYGLQKFKIPKIKRPEPVPSPPRIVDDVVEENWDLPDENFVQTESLNVNDDVVVDEVRIDDAPVAINRKDADDKKSEVTSTTGETAEESRIAKNNVAQTTDDGRQKDTSAQSTVVESLVTEISTNINDENSAKSKESETPATDKPPGDWQNLLEAKFLEKINELLHSKKMKEQFKKFIGTDLSDGSDKDNDELEIKKTASKKKRRLISSSESSDEECLAERLGIAETTDKDKSGTTESRVNEDANVKKVTTDEKTNDDQAVGQDSAKNNNSIELSSDTSHENRAAPVKKTKPFRRKKREPKAGKSGSVAGSEIGKSNEDAQSMQSETTNEKLPAPKEQPAKAKTRRRNSLEMLQEDVREMFISDEVVTATGFRSCRLQKEDQTQMNSSMESLAFANSRKKGSTSSLDRTGTKITSDADETSRDQISSARGRGSRSKTRKRARGRGKQRISAKEIASSDSDDEDSSRIEAPTLNDVTDVSGKPSGDSVASDAASEAPKDKDDVEDTHFLRRSERVGLRGTAKEPRICLKKTDTGKSDASKTMFDSSSDESFGIDVSELTAAVDISLHPEPQTSSSPVGKSVEKIAVPKKRRSGKRGSMRNANKAAEGKLDSVGSADEVESIASDLSRESSLTRGKKITTIGIKVDTNEELLSDILGGLVDPNGSNQPDNDAEDAVTPAIDAKQQNAKKKKKKKSVWQLGIVRKKKKKIQSPIPTSVTENDEFNVPNAELESSFEIPESKIDPTDVPTLSETETSIVDPKEEMLSDSSAAIMTTENLKYDASGSADVTHKLEPFSPNRTNSSTEIPDTNVEDPIDDKKSLIELVDNKSDIDIGIDNIANIGVRRLMSYTWSARKERFKCMLCTWIGKNIVHHYTLGHPGKEMMISRLSIPESKRAVGQAMVDNYDARNSDTVTKEIRKFTCRFCAYSTEGSLPTALEAFYEHCTTHTGEYRFRCNSCPYQTVAKSSMRTHYYRKACANKHHGNVNLAITEDPVPADDFLYGYLCTKCNFVQLKEDNVIKHVKTFHQQLPQVDIVKIDMSSYVDKNLYDSTGDHENAGQTASDDMKTENDVKSDGESVGRSKIVDQTIDDDNKIDIVDEPPRVTRSRKCLEKKRTDSESTSLANDEIDVTPVTGNLNAFVCPPELENKEDEIQHERRKKMQEVVDDIGIMNKTNEKRDLSIIDKLKDKMTTNIDESLAEAEAQQLLTDAEILANETKSVMPMLIVDSVTSLANEKSIIDDGRTNVNPDDDECEKSLNSVKTEPADFADRGTTDVAIDEAETDTEDKTERKSKDPLVNLENRQKDESTDCDDSDHDEPIEQSRSYESDSTDHSDGELPADVNSLLEESFNMTTPVNAPMMTTIQRLAAKLQGEKSLTATGVDSSEIAQSPIDDDATEKNIPKPPNAIPITDIQRFFGKRNLVSPEIGKSAESNEKSVPPIEPVASPPKKFIRLRRLSGDKLSVPVTTNNDSPAKISSLAVEKIDSPPTTTTEITETTLDPENDDDECSFLRIESVVSLAPGNESDTNDTMINDIRMAVASTSKISSPSSVSLLKKSSPNILKRSSPASTSATAIRHLPLQIVPSPIATLPNKQNLKLVKVIKGRTLIKQKDGTHRVFGSDAKNLENFTEMLKPEKLRNLYKCMARNCSYTTNCIQLFGSHYRKHKDTIDRKQAIMITSYDFQRCAYCTETLTTWNSMCDHLRDKHVYCKYQCGYCFYRALAQSYVELHQMSVHQGSKIFILIGSPEKPPIEVIDRREYVIPFVCHHECGKAFYVPGAFLAHLRTKHGNSLSIFKCHLCPAPLFKAEQLVGHYKLHGIYKYQCLYCLFGSEQSSDVHSHLSASHYNRPPHILERTLQPRPVRDKDVIQQLVVQNVDLTYRSKEITLVQGQTDAEQQKIKHWVQLDVNDDGPSVGVVSAIGTIAGKSLFPGETLELVDVTNDLEGSVNNCVTGTPIITKFRKSSPVRMTDDNIVIVDDSTIVESPKDSSSDPNAEAVTNVDVDGGRKVDDSARRSSCNEEFVNFNILDDPAFIGLASDRTTGLPMSSRLQTDNNADSDIEILEDIAVTPNKATAKISNSRSSPLTVGEQKTPVKDDKDDKVAIVNDADRSVIVSSSGENSLDLSINVNPIAVEVEENFERPRTLEDIRNTGFTGCHLYRCGYDSCEYGAETPILLRNHIKECIFAGDAKNLNCVHCSKRFMKIGFLLEHFKLHGLKRFGCSLCKERWTQTYQAMAHMKLKHRQTYSKIIPADPKNPAADGLFIVEPIASTGERTRGKKRRRAKSADIEKMLEVQKMSYGPTEIDSLPRQPIYQQEVHCAVCPYRSKVRTNIMRHLQLHAKDETVPETGPINPVPCLDKNEKMFDKMVNLASSSHQNGRMGGTKPKEKIDNDAEFLPKFVPENKRYVCGVTDCNYLSIDEGMLRTHQKALHPDELYFRCPHCPAQSPGHEAAQNVAIDKMGIHLKMHDTRLYKCSHCNHHHYHRHVVERHLADKHSESNPFVKIIREIDNTDNTEKPSQSEIEGSNTADPESDHWKCNVCDYKCIYKSEMVKHAITAHDEKSQFKCTMCSHKSNNMVTFDQHVQAKHPNDFTSDYEMVYQKIKGSGPRRTVDGTESTSLGEPFDTTPLWRRDMPRIRHIRGILFEDDEAVAESPSKSAKRKSDVDATTKMGKTKISKSSNEHLDRESSNGGTILSETSMRNNTEDCVVDVEGGEGTIETSRLTEKFGPYGSPLANFWRCTICRRYKTKYKQDIRDHLYRDLKYFRFRCAVCGFAGVGRNSTLKHFMRTHENRRPTDQELTVLPVDEDLETWVQTLIKSQLAQMRGMVVDVDGNILGEIAKKKTNNPTTGRRSTMENSSKPTIASITQGTLNDAGNSAETVDLNQVISEMKMKTVTGDGDVGMQDNDDDDSDANDALVIDSKDDGLEQEAPDNATIVDDCEPTIDEDSFIVCKHCNEQFERSRGFKLHVQIRHLRRLAYQCPYCDTSSNSDKLMIRHLRLKHSHLPERFDENSTKNLPELTNEFWEREYGLSATEKPRKRRRTTDDAASQDPLDKNARGTGTHLCGSCGFRAINTFGLGVHMRVHAITKNYKCAYCTFASSEKSELWQHSEQNHGNIDWKVGNGDAAIIEVSTSETEKLHSSTGDRTVDDYAEYVAAEASYKTHANDDAKSQMSYLCFYCHYSRTSIDELQEHWKLTHKNSTKSNTSSMPFRYKEFTDNTMKKTLRCGYCPKRGLAASIRLHSRKKHPSKPVKFVEIVVPVDNWICQWCNDTVDSEAKKKIHQNMFHSHLPPNFRRSIVTNNSNATDAPSCPRCTFKTTSFTAMQKHVVKHVDSVRCKRCEKTFPDVSIAILHNTQAHPGEVSAIEDFTTNVDKIMSRIDWRGFDNCGGKKVSSGKKRGGVAKKSTTKSLIVVRPKPTDIRAVARKSTNPLPRYPPGTRFYIDDDDNVDANDAETRKTTTTTSVCWYGLPVVPINLNNISTYMTLSGGRQMKLNCTALAQLFDIEPKVLVEDVNGNLKKKIRRNDDERLVDVMKNDDE